MAVVERATASGAALAGLLRECVAAPRSQEGFLLGRVTEEITSHISDSHQHNSVTEVFIDVVSTLPAPDACLFYGPSGRIKEKVLNEMISEAAHRVVGWYKYRRDDSPRPTARDRIVSRGLKNFFHNNYFMFCNIACKSSSADSTHSYSYRFSKVNSNGELEELEDVTRNLGEKVAGYKRGAKVAADDPFDRAVKSAVGEGMGGVGVAVDDALARAALEAVEQETAIRTVSCEIEQMLGLLADHHRERSSELGLARTAAVRIQEEASAVKSIAEAAVEPRTPSEPFDFVKDLIKDNLQQSAEDRPVKSASFSIGRSSATTDDNSVDDFLNRPKTTGHKRIHSEDTTGSSNNTEKERTISSSASWKSNVTNLNHDSDG